jgi:hypothetical protein
VSHDLHDWEQEDAPITKAYPALPPGGSLLIDEALGDDERRNALGQVMSLNLLIETPGGFDDAGADCHGWLREAGFRQPRVE